MRNVLRTYVAGARNAVRTLLAGLVLLALVLAAGCLSADERRAVSVADCVAQLALQLPEREPELDPAEVTTDDLVLAVQVIRGVAACRKAHPPVADGGT